MCAFILEKVSKSILFLKLNYTQVYQKVYYD